MPAHEILRAWARSECCPTPCQLPGTFGPPTACRPAKPTFASSIIQIQRAAAGASLPKTALGEPPGRLSTQRRSSYVRSRRPEADFRQAKQCLSAPTVSTPSYLLLRDALAPGRVEALMVNNDRSSAHSRLSVSSLSRSALCAAGSSSPKRRTACRLR